MNGCVEQWMDKDALTLITKGKINDKIKITSTSSGSSNSPPPNYNNFLGYIIIAQQGV